MKRIVLVIVMVLVALLAQAVQAGNVPYVYTCNTCEWSKLGSNLVTEARDFRAVEVHRLPEDWSWIHVRDCRAYLNPNTGYRCSECQEYEWKGPSAAVGWKQEGDLSLLCGTADHFEYPLGFWESDEPVYETLCDECTELESSGKYEYAFGIGHKEEAEVLWCVGAKCRVRLVNYVRLRFLDYETRSVTDCSRVNSTTFTDELWGPTWFGYHYEDGIQDFCYQFSVSGAETLNPSDQEIGTSGFWIEGQAPGCWFEVGSKDHQDVWLSVQADLSGTVNVDFLPLGANIHIWRVHDGVEAVETVKPGRPKISFPE